jgi:ubiquinone biosynthesis protein
MLFAEKNSKSYQCLRLFCRKKEEYYQDNLVASLQTLGPVFIKFGQSLSTRADLIGIKMADKLMVLQDKLPAFDFLQVKEIIELDFLMPIAELFSSFEVIPAASASIAQVHKAITVDGQTVAVKVRRPLIVEQFNKDLAFLAYLACWLEKKIPHLKRYSPQELVRVFAASTRLELNLSLEAAALSEMRDNFIDDKSVYLPKPLWHLISEQVLTMEWVEGIPVNNLKAMDEAGLDRAKIAANLAILFFNQAYRDGFFHADLHAGNILVNAHNQIILLDFGITGRLSKEDSIFVAEVLRSFLARDYLQVARLHHLAGYIPKVEDVAAFAQHCRAIGEPIVGLSVKQISIARLLAKLFKVTEEFDMKTNPKLMLLQKTILMIEGVGSRLDENVNMWQLAQPWIEDWAIENFGIEAKLLDFAKKIANKIKSAI